VLIDFNRHFFIAMGTAEKLILTTAYLPPVVYISAVANHSASFIEAHENYSKQSYRNRCTIATANGPLNLIIPVQKVKPGKNLVTKVLIDNEYKWQKLHWGAIVSAYKNSPFFEYYEPDLLPFYTNSFGNLFEFNLLLVKCLLKTLKITPIISLTEKFSEQFDLSVLDLREMIHPKKPLPMFNTLPYKQVFFEKYGFIPNLSIIDLIFNTGPESNKYL